MPVRGRSQLWSNYADRGTVAPWPYGDWLKMIAVRSGTTRVGEWVSERRNVRHDYRRLFGEEPPPVQRIGIMTHTDNTNSAATAYYGDITFHATSTDSATAAASRLGTGSPPSTQ